MRFVLSVVGLIGVLFFSSPTFADWNPLTSKNPASVQMEVVQADFSGTTIRFSIPGFSTEQIRINGEAFTQITIPGSSLTDTKGFPEVPRISRNFLIPASSVPSVKVINLKKIEADLGTLVPSKGSIMRNVLPSSVPYSFASFYEDGGVFPETIAKDAKPFSLRDLRGVNISFFPVQFDSKTGKTTIITQAEIKISTPTPPSATFRLLNHTGHIEEGFLNIYKRRFANFSALDARLQVLPEHFVQEVGSMLIITHPDFVSGMAPYVKWKREMGFIVKMATLEEAGSTFVKIKEFIQKEYNQNHVGYVLLVGDAEFVPFHEGTAGNAWGMEADPMYSLVEGADNYPDIFISRFSVKTPEELANIVNRTVNYEKNPDANGDWYSRGSGIASMEGYPTDYERAEILREMLEKYNYTSIDKFYEPDTFTAEIINALNEGRSFINYIGHGSHDGWVTGDFSNYQIDLLTNTNKLPFIVSVACVNGEFGSGDDSFAEKWLKAGTSDNPTGAIAVFASSTNQSWVPPTVGQKEIARILVEQEANSIGGLFFNGSVAVLEDNSDSADQTFQTWHIFGDASLQLRTNKPEEIKVQLPSSPLEGQELVFDVGEEKIHLGIVQGEELLGSGISGPDGKIVIQLKDPLPKETKVLLTFTGYNKIPNIVELPLI